MRTCGALLCLVLALTGCRAGGDGDAAPERSGTPTATDSATPEPSRPTADAPTTDTSATDTSATDAPTDTPTTGAAPTRPSTTAGPTQPPEFDTEAALAIVRHLADEIGPRETTGRAYAAGAAYVEQRLRGFGYDVVRQRVDVPAGNSWGIDVPAGTADNLIVTTRGFRADRPHLVVGAHLDTVPQAPGAEDNASGVASVLELARLAAFEPPPTPVAFVVFAAEEPRGEGDDLHHFGSRRYVESLSAVRRDAIVGMLSLDRVGAGSDVRIRTGGTGSGTMIAELAAAAERLGVDDVGGGENRASDHWSFEKAGIPAARLGGNAYAGYHSEADRMDQLNGDMLALNGRIAWTWLTSIS